MFEVEELIRPHLKNIEPYSSARGLHNSNEEVLLDANENPYGTYNRYPDPLQSKLKEEISGYKQIAKGNIFLGNGSDEIIDLLYRIFCTPGSDRAMIFDPTFGMYETAAQINNVELIRMKLSADSFQPDLNQAAKLLADKKPKLTFICSPNNPTANFIAPEAVEFLLKNSKGMIVVDEAYIDFSAEKSWLKAVDDFPNLIVLQTLSKAWGLAGARIGLAFTNPTVIKYLNKVKPPYNISAANQQVALEKLRNKPQHADEIQTIIAERERLAEALAGCNVVQKVYPSDANFLLVEIKNASEAYHKLLQKNIIVRDRSTQVADTLRISIGRPGENDQLIRALKKLRR